MASKFPMSEMSRLVRYDVEPDEGEELPRIQFIPEGEVPLTRKEFDKNFDIPEGLVVKLRFDGKLIPWSLVPYYSSIASVDFEVVRPSLENRLKLVGDGSVTAESIANKKVSELEERIVSLEASLEEKNLQEKAERDLELLTQQISLLSRRFEETDQAEGVQKP